MINFKETEYGFEYGSAKVTRVSSDEKRGWVVLNVETPKTTIQLYVTKTGKLRLFDNDGEWFKLKK